MTHEPQGGRSSTRTRSRQYFRNGAKRHWDPYAIDLETDVRSLAALDRRSFTKLRGMLAMFGAGEESVTDDLVPLAATLDDTDDSLFVASQLYDEARHTAFFDRYWQEAIQPAADARGLDPGEPTDARWFSEAYEELFDRVRQAMHALEERDSPENRADAYAHYHLTAEGILGQTAYHAVEETFQRSDAASLPGMVEGFGYVRRDEGRHVGFGMTKLRSLLADGAVDETAVATTLDELRPLVGDVVADMGWKYLPGPDGEDLAAYADQTRAARLDQLTGDGDLPSETELVDLVD